MDIYFSDAQTYLSLIPERPMFPAKSIEGRDIHGSVLRRYGKPSTYAIRGEDSISFIDGQGEVVFFAVLNKDKKTMPKEFSDKTKGVALETSDKIWLSTVLLQARERDVPVHGINVTNPKTLLDFPLASADVNVRLIAAHGEVVGLDGKRVNTDRWTELMSIRKTIEGAGWTLKQLHNADMKTRVRFLIDLFRFVGMGKEFVVNQKAPGGKQFQKGNKESIKGGEAFKRKAVLSQYADEFASKDPNVVLDKMIEVIKEEQKRWKRGLVIEEEKGILIKEVTDIGKGYYDKLNDLLTILKPSRVPSSLAVHNTNVWQFTQELNEEEKSLITQRLRDELKRRSNQGA